VVEKRDQLVVRFVGTRLEGRQGKVDCNLGMGWQKLMDLHALDSRGSKGTRGISLERME